MVVVPIRRDLITHASDRTIDEQLVAKRTHPQMLMTITLTKQPAAELGYLLHKGPGRVHTRPLAFRRAGAFHPA